MGSTHKPLKPTMKEAIRIPLSATQTSPFGKGRLTISFFRRKCTPIPASRDFPRRGKQVLSLRRFHKLTSVAWRRHRRALKGRRLIVQYRRQLGPGSKVLCRTFAFQGRRLPISNFTAPSDSYSSPSSRAEEACHMTLQVKIATATMSREISQVDDCVGDSRKLET